MKYLSCSPAHSGRGFVLAAMLAVVLLLAAHGPAAAQESGESESENSFGEGLSLLEQGTRMILRGLMSEMEPAFEDLERMLGDLSGYHPPEMLPNGDIIIRRREPLPEVVPDKDGQIDL